MGFVSWLVGINELAAENQKTLEKLKTSEGIAADKAKPDKLNGSGIVMTWLETKPVVQVARKLYSILTKPGHTIKSLMGLPMELLLDDPLSKYVLGFAVHKAAQPDASSSSNSLRISKKRRAVNLSTKLVLHPEALGGQKHWRTLRTNTK
ncbi:MAG: hypothetical protein M1835_008102 [Candelina submexicana]|nr:MAG: hypothetical protein M1835_008102 [Candelina submexicana]